MKPSTAIDCETTDTMLPWYVNGTLALTDREAVRAHIETCADCRAEAELLDAIREELPKVANDAEHPASLDAGARQVHARIARFRQARRIALAAGLAVLFTGAGSLVLHDYLTRPVFHTVTTPAAQSRYAFRAEIAIQGDNPAAALREIMREYGATLLGSRNSEGRMLYLLQVNASSPTEAAGFEARLRNDARIDGFEKRDTSGGDPQ